ncbi:MAG: transcription termination/antitermination protein NusA [Fimbriimonadaceae bacterium]|nr:transcription termination/antitermination protein NusA [Fimbriimonadaceae bacterium]QYK55031.1 MAG: transcription termination/antitermination protein NusA [Fimbriimonadaceae bacterium]
MASLVFRGRSMGTMDILQELKQIATEREIPVEELKYELEQALAVAYKRFRNSSGEAVVRLDPSKKSGAVVEKEVVGEVLDPAVQIGLESAKRYNPNTQIGDFVDIEIDTNTFGRIAAQTFKQVLTQKLREAELRRVHEQFSEELGEVVNGLVTRREEGSVMIQVGRHEVELPKREQVGTDDYRPNERIKVYVLKIDDTYRGFRVIVSRSHPNLLRKLVELEVPEIAEGLVEIKSVAREPGQRAKIAVLSHDERIDAVGSCVGQRGSRIQSIMDELRPEKIDVVPWSEDPRQFIINALSPAKVNTLRLNEEERSAYVIVPDTQLSLAIGRGGQNVRLAARLTEWKIDIRSEGQAAQEAKEQLGTKTEAAEA